MDETLGRVVRRTVRKRRRLPGIGPRRIDVLVPGKKFLPMRGAEHATRSRLRLRFRIPCGPALAIPRQDHYGRQRFKASPKPRTARFLFEGKRHGDVDLYPGIREGLPRSRNACEPRIEAAGTDFGVVETVAASEGGLPRRSQPVELEEPDRRLRAIEENVHAPRRKRSDPREDARARGRELRVPRKCRRPRNRIRDMIEARVGRACRRIVRNRAPAAISAEALDFRGTGLSRRLNRIVRNCGRGFLERRLQDLGHRRGIGIFLVNRRNTSRRCFSCGRTDKRNRPARNRFRCRNAASASTPTSTPPAACERDASGRRCLPAPFGGNPAGFRGRILPVDLFLGERPSAANATDFGLRE